MIASLPSKDSGNISRDKWDDKAAERSAKQGQKPGEKQARTAKDRQQPARAPDKRRQVVRDETPRYIRAGSEESRRIGYDNRPRVARFTDIFSDRR